MLAQESFEWHSTDQHQLGGHIVQNGEPNLWGGLTILRNGQIDRRWRRIQMVILFNIFAIPLVFGASVTGVATIVGVKAAVSWVGYFLHMAIAFAAHRGERLNRFWTRKMAALERLDNTVRSGENRVRVEIFSSPEFAKLQRDARNLTKIAFLVAGLVISAWLITAVYYTVEAMK